MLSIVKRIIQLSKSRKWRIQLAIILSIFEGIFAIGPEMLIMFSVYTIMNGALTHETVYLISGLLVGSVVFRALFKRVIDGLQSGSGYEIFADERMRIGEHLKRLPMGYFSNGSMGDVTSVVTSDILFVEMYGMETVTKIVNAYVSMTLGCIMMFVFDWRIGIIISVTVILANESLKKMDIFAKRHSFIRQDQMGRLVGAVIEFVKGIGVIKAFNLKGDQFEKVDNNFREARDAALEFERKFADLFVNFHGWFALGIGGILMFLTWFMVSGQINFTFGIMIMIYVFHMFAPYQVLGSVVALARIMEAALDRYDAVMNLDIIDADGIDIDLKSHDVTFQNVTFAYEEENVLKDVSFHVEANSMTALVGKSGCGKSTITNLIARFWDTKEGKILVGGVDVKSMTCDSLLKNISMVFQDVYLFQDSILNNIKFGNPSATMEEIVEACKKARCYEFIMALENGFETIVEEGGVSLSGGEKQRISIARAILKDAPIVLLDEATASVDPDNEKYIQEAISELIKNKTLIVIAHKLRTIKHAHQIVVLDKGEIIEIGKHESLMKQEGTYKELWDRRTLAKDWTIGEHTAVS